MAPDSSSEQYGAADARECSCPDQLRESVLTIDGGGIRGYSSLVILRELLIIIRRREQENDTTRSFRNGQEAETTGNIDKELPLPCHYFNYMFGTSTGGIIAIMLGRLRMSVKQCLDTYEDLGTKVFRKKRPLRFTQYSHRKLEKVMKDKIRQHCRDNDAALWNPVAFTEDSPSRFGQTRVGVVATRRAKPSHKPHLFRTYYNAGLTLGDATAVNASVEHESRWLDLNIQSDRNSPTILEAARGTSAAPHYFKIAKIDSSEYMDGGIMANNPSIVAWNEVTIMHQLTDCKRTSGGIRYLVSLGTGKNAPCNVFSDGSFIYKIRNIVSTAIKGLGDPEPVHQHMTQLCPTATASSHHTTYSRFNVRSGLEKIALDACTIDSDGKTNRTLRYIEHHTMEYTRDPDVHGELEKLAKHLVDHRRAKCRDPTYSDLTQPGPAPPTYLRSFIPYSDLIPPVRRRSTVNGTISSRHNMAEMDGFRETAELYTDFGGPDDGEDIDMPPQRGATWSPGPTSP